MRRSLILAFATLALLPIACSSPDAEPASECGPNGECPPGFTCDPIDRRCVAVGTAPDAGQPQPDAMDVGCPVPTGGPTLHATAISADETWTANGSPHIVSSQLRVIGGATLTIEPCAEVHLGKDAVMVAGFSSATGKIRALGTQARPITFTQKVPGERFDGLEATYPSSVELAWVTIEGGGANRFRRGASLTGWGDGALPVKPVLKLDHVTVKGSAGMGVLLERNGTFMPGSDALTVTGSEKLNGGEGEAVRVDSASMGDVPPGSYSGNSLDSVTIYGSTVEKATVLRPLGVPYRLAAGTSLAIKPGGSLELLAGTELVLGNDAYIDVRNGSFKASGTADEPVYIRPRAGERFLNLQVRYPGRMSLTHTFIDGGGHDRFTWDAAIVARGDATLPIKPILHVDHVTVTASGGPGVVVERYAAFDATSTDLVVAGAGQTQPDVGRAVRIAMPAVHTLPSGRYVNNAIDEISVDSTATITEGEERFPARGVPYATSGSIVARAPTQTGPVPRVVFEPGVTVKFPKGLFGIQIGVGSTGSAAWPGEIVAEGTAEQPIVFTSADKAPQAGDWRGIYFQGYRPTGNKIAHARIEFAGASCLCSVGGCAGEEEAAVMFFLYPLEQPVVSDTTFAKIAGHGIYSNFRSDATNLDMTETAGNAFDDVTGCKQTMIVSTTGQCSRACY